MAEQFTERRQNKITGIRMRTVNLIVIIIACAIAFALVMTARSTNTAYNEFTEATSRYSSCERAATLLMDTSTYLTTQVRSFAITHDVKYLNNFFEETYVSQNRDKAVATLKEYLSGRGAAFYLEKALGYSNELVEVENYSMKLVVEAMGYEVSDYAVELNEVKLSAEDEALSAEEKLSLAISLLYDDSYLKNKELVEENVNLCTAELIDEASALSEASSERLQRLFVRQQVLTVLFLVCVIAVVLLFVTLVLLPLNTFILRITEYKSLPMRGAYELRYMAHAYNVMYEENRRHNANLEHQASHDPLTGLFNRGAYERLLEAYRDDQIGFIMIDIDYFKNFNDEYGHDMGDRVLKKVADQLTRAFRSTDYICRFGGDEFSVIMTEMSSKLKDVVADKIESVRSALRDDSDGVPKVTLSIGVAFSDKLGEESEIFKAADKAQYKVKEAGRDGVAFYQ